MALADDGSCQRLLELIGETQDLSLSLRRASFVAFIFSILPTKLECGQAHDDVDRRRPNLPTACSISLLSHDDFVGRADANCLPLGGRNAIVFMIHLGRLSRRTIPGEEASPEWGTGPCQMVARSGSNRRAKKSRFDGTFVSQIFPDFVFHRSLAIPAVRAIVSLKDD